MNGAKTMLARKTQRFTTVDTEARRYIQMGKLIN